MKYYLQLYNLAFDLTLFRCWLFLSFSLFVPSSLPLLLSRLRTLRKNSTESTKSLFRYRQTNFLINQSFHWCNKNSVSTEVFFIISTKQLFGQPKNLFAHLQVTWFIQILSQWRKDYSTFYSHLSSNWERVDEYSSLYEVDRDFPQ